MIDPLDGAEQPHCPHCGTVMLDDPRGHECGGCGLMVLRDGKTVFR
jgi:ribosomal protein S27AE